MGMLSELSSVILPFFLFWYCYMLFLEESVGLLTILFYHELSSASFTFYSHL